MRTINALGFIEVYGMVAGIEAADAMLKSAQVRLLRQHCVNPGLLSLVVEGDLAACRAAVDAGVAAASRLGRVIASHVIGRPDNDTETLILDLLRDPEEKPDTKPTGTATDSVTGIDAAPPAAQTAPEANPPAPPPPAPKPADKSKTAQIAANSKTATPGRGKFAEILAFIAEAAQGRNWKELKAHFPGLSQHERKQLDAAVASGELRKVGGRYCSNLED